VWLLAMMASVGYLCRVDITNAAPQLMAEFHLSESQIGTLASAFMLGYTAFQVPSGWLADRVSVRRLFFWLMVIWTALTAALALVGRSSAALRFGSVIGELYVLRLLYGVFAAPTYPGAGHAIASNVSPSLQGRANSAVLASIGVGAAVAAPLVGTVSLHYGWRAAMLTASTVAAAGALVWYLFAPRDSTPIELPNSAAPSLTPSTRSPLMKRSFWLLCSSYFLESYLGYVFVFWLYLYLIRVRHFEQLKASWITSVPWLLTLLAIPLGGMLSDLAVGRWGATWGRRAVPLPAMLASAALFVITGRTGSASIAATAFALATAVTLACEAPFWASMNQLAGRQSGIGGGVLNFCGNLGGVVSPWLTPRMAERWGWTATLSWTAIVAIACAALWLGIDVEKERAIATDEYRT
jgi:MFS family permease